MTPVDVVGTPHNLFELFHITYLVTATCSKKLFFFKKNKLRIVISQRECLLNMLEQCYIEL